MLKGRTAAFAILFAVHLLWGGTLVAAKIAFEDFSPLIMNALRMSLGAILLLSLAAVRGELWPPPAALRLLVPLGMLGMGAYAAVLFLSLNLTTAVDGAIIAAVNPVATVLLAAVFLGERATTRRWLGSALSLVGVVVVVALGSAGTAAEVPNRVLGDLGLLFGAVGWALYTVIQRSLRHSPPIPTLGYLFAFGTLVVIPLGLWDATMGGRFEPTARGIGAVLFLAWGVYVVGFLGWAYALRQLEAGQVASFFNLIPIAGVASAAILLGETIRPAHVVGGALVLAGVWLASAQRKSLGAVTRPRSVAAGPDASPTAAAPDRSG